MITGWGYIKSIISFQKVPIVVPELISGLVQLSKYNLRCLDNIKRTLEDRMSTPHTYFKSYYVLG